MKFQLSVHVLLMASLQEWWLGDGIYNSCPRVMTRYLCPQGGTLTKIQVFVNAHINHYRQRVEVSAHCSFAQIHAVPDHVALST